MEERRFKKSALSIKQQRNKVLVIQILLPIFFFFILFYSGEFNIDLRTNLIMFIIVTIFIEIIFYKSFISTSERVNKVEIILNDSEIVRHNQKPLIILPFNNIIKIKIVYLRGKVQFLKFYYTKKSMNIIGFENMDEILEILTNKLKNSEIEIKKSNLKINLRNPIIFGIYNALFYFLIIVLIKNTENIYENIQLFIPLIIGASFLLVRPVTKRYCKRFDIKFGKFDLIVGIFLIIVSIANILIKYLL